MSLWNRSIMGGGKVKKPGVDLYPWMFTFSLCQLLIVLISYSVIWGAGETLTESLRRNQFGQGMVLVMIVHIAIIIIDRMFYRLSFKEIDSSLPPRQRRVYKTVKAAKVILLIAEVLAIHILFIHRMAQPDQDVTDLEIGMWGNPAMLIYYFLIYAYFVLLARQIHHDLPASTGGHNLTSSTHLFNRTVYRVYRSIPLLEEIRILLDWTVAKTSLDTFMWFKLEDAYSSLYFVKGDMTVRKMYYPAEHRWLSEKIGLGLCGIVGLVLLLLAPILLFSSFNPVRISNRVDDATSTVSLRVESSTDTLVVPLYEASSAVTIRDFSKCEIRRYLRSFPLTESNADIQSVVFPEASTTPFLVSPALIQATVDALSEPRSAQLELSYELKGRNTKTFVEGGQTTDVLRFADQLKALLNGTRTELTVDRFYNPYAELGETGVSSIHGERRNATLFLLTSNDTFSGSQQHYWIINGTNTRSSASRGQSDKCPDTSDPRGRFTLVVVSPPVLPFSSGSAQGGGGGQNLSVVGLYITVVLAIGRFLRLMCQGASQRVIYEEMPNVDLFVDICNGVYTARLRGDLVKEYKLYFTLIKLYRSPELLLQVSGGELHGHRPYPPGAPKVE